MPEPKTRGGREMKKLYLIRSVLKDWFTVRLTVTLTVAAVFVISFVAMFFVATKVSTEYLEDTETEKYYYNELIIDEEKCADANEKLTYLLDDGFYSRWLGLSLPPLTDNAYVDGYIMYTEKNGSSIVGSDFIELKCAPVFSDAEQDRAAPIRNLLGYDYEMTSGRDITKQDLDSKRAVAVAPEGWALKVGDRISCFGHELEIIGLNKPSKYNKRRDECIVVPYFFLNECMNDGLSPEEAASLKYNEAYGHKPQNNEYIPEKTEYDVQFWGHSPFGDERVYPAYCRLMFTSFMFEERLDDGQKAELAGFLGISPDDFTNSYDMFYFEQVKSFNSRARKECLTAGIFCILNVVMIAAYLSSGTVKEYRIFRVYGCSRFGVFCIDLICLAVIVGLSLVTAVLLCRPAASMFYMINHSYEFRQSCVDISAGIFVLVSVIACIPAAVGAAVKTPLGK